MNEAGLKHGTTTLHLANWILYHFQLMLINYADKLYHKTLGEYPQYIYIYIYIMALMMLYFLGHFYK